MPVKKELKHLLILNFFTLLTWVHSLSSAALSDINAHKEVVQKVQGEHTSMDAPAEVQATFKEEDFRPYMLDHYNEGCPTNSTCTKEMGMLYKKWSEALSASAGKKKLTQGLENFRRQVGVPFEVWVTQTDKHYPGLITWEGNCNYHNREGEKKIKIGVSLVKNIDDLLELEKTQIIATRKLYRLNPSTNKVIRYRIPQADTPLYIDGDALIYQRSENGIYYGISINPEGHLTVVDTETPQEFPKSLPCPKILNEVQTAHPEDFEKEIYAGVYCQKTWNRQSKAFETILLGWSCD